MVLPAINGAKNTQMLRISMGKFRNNSTLWRMAAVHIRPMITVLVMINDGGECECEFDGDGDGDGEIGQHTWIDCTTNISSKRIPRLLIKPIVEFIEPFFDKKFGRTEVEPPVWRDISFIKRSYVWFSLSVCVCVCVCVQEYMCARHTDQTRGSHFHDARH